MMPLLAAACAGIAAWVSLGALAVVRDAAGSIGRVGLLPAWWLLPVLVGVFVGAVAMLKLAPRTTSPLFASVILWLPWMPGRVPAAFLIWTGHLAAAVWVAIAVAMVMAARPSGPRWAIDPRTAPRVAAAAACVLYLASAWSLADLLPGGDEPHYLIITQSLLKDGDLQIENNHQRRDYAEYFRGRLNPDFLRRGTNGQIYSIHAPGLPAVIAPAYALYGYRGVVLFLAVAAALGGALMWVAAYGLTASVAAAWFAWAAWALTVPFFFQAFSIFPDGLGATLVLFAAVPLLTEESSTFGISRTTSMRRWVATGVTLALLPWLHTRFSIIAAALGFFMAARLVAKPEDRAKLAAFLAVPAVSAVAWFAFFRSIYGTFSPAAPYAGYTQSSAANILNGLPGLLFDQQFGILPYAPVYAFCLVGMIAMGRRRPRLAIELSATLLAYLLSSSAYHMWWGGSSAPARFAVPVLPLLVLPGAWLWQAARHSGTRALAFALLVVSIAITATLVTVDGGHMAYNFRDGYSRLLEWTNPIVDLTGALPTLFRQTSGGAVARALIWVVSITAVWFGLKIAGRDRVAPAALGLLLAAITVSSGLAWTFEGSDGVTPAASQLDLLQRIDPAVRPVGIDLSAMHRIAEAEVVSRLTIGGSDGRSELPRRTLLVVPGILPAGTYELDLSRESNPSGVAQLVVGREARPVASWDLRSGASSSRATFDLPVSVGSIAIQGDDEAVEHVKTMTLRALRVVPPADRPAQGFARRVERYGPGLVYFFDDATFPEEPGFWVRGAAEAQFAVQPTEPHGTVKLFVRNAAAANAVTVRIDGQSTALNLQPREERFIPVELPPGHNAVIVRVESDTGFRPSETEAGSTDDRYLGVWIELRR